ncbi:hypothetical protein IV203_023994 [Nitzschia inconspicua]|uniref:Uncharacterized protein n=1 Tax=Nitzschia inconspicua TaxID=303405 RepID=A0A9K3PB84_9STRA|nr:hypothetical protein IV203_024485 [Nitzschia inconspicua]KAG7340451.1 hypothetical protein IV203_023994 [Nitzschia inconspicua]
MEHVGSGIRDRVLCDYLKALFVDIFLHLSLGCAIDSAFRSLVLRFSSRIGEWCPPQSHTLFGLSSQRKQNETIAYNCHIVAYQDLRLGRRKCSALHMSSMAASKSFVSAMEIRSSSAPLWDAS